MAVGLKKKGKKKPEVLAAGSHPALVSYQLSKEFNADFKPKLCKSESDIMPDVEETTENLSDELKNKGFESFILKKGNNLQFIISRFGLDIIKYDTEHQNNTLIFKNHSKHNISNQYPSLSQDLAKIINDKCQILNINKVKKNG